MKRIFILVLSIASLVSCKKTIDPTITNEGNEKSDALITLSSTAPTGRAANAGVREDLFQTGDLIGVIAAHSDNAEEPGTEAASWTKAVYFDNKPALFSAEKVEEPALDPKVSTFNWGVTGQGGLTDNQYYPAKKGKIFLFAYYPYTTEASYVAPDGTSSTPSLKVELSDGAIAGVAQEAQDATIDANLRQADVMYYAAAASISSIAPNATPLAFKHGLAQLSFMVKLAPGASPCKLKKIEFKTVKSGVMDITTGGFTYETATTGYEQAAVYTITPKTDTPVPASDATESLNILKIIGGAPLMIFPLDAATIQKGELTVTCDFSSNGTPHEKPLTVPLSSVAKDFLAGKLNVFNINVAVSGITLEATIAPWATDGSIETLPAE